MKRPTNGSAKRKLPSWIESFVESTSQLGTPKLFRKWAAISTIASVLEQKVWVMTASAMYPNLYVFLVGHPGIGKTRIMGFARGLLEAMPEPYIAPTSVNAASIIDHLKECKRVLIRSPEDPLDYNSMVIHVGEFTTFMSKYETDLMGLLTDFYNVSPYGQRRRGQGGFKIEIPRPQLNILCGVQPAALMQFMPQEAWGQGFASRIILIYSEEKIIVDDFAEVDPIDNSDLVHDLLVINSLCGQFKVSPEYRECIMEWRETHKEDYPPKPTHPRLHHYNARRKEFVYRLSMVSALDREDALILGRADFLRALSWLIEAEQYMPHVFESSGTSTDSAVMDELLYLIRSKGSMTEDAVLRHVRQKVPAHAVMRLVNVMVDSGMLKVVTQNRFGVRTFDSGDPSLP